MIRMCENEPLPGAKFAGTGAGGGILEMTLFVKLVLRDFWPCIAQKR